MVGLLKGHVLGLVVASRGLGPYVPFSSTEPSMQRSPSFEKEVEDLKEVVNARVCEGEGVGDDGERIEFQSTDLLNYEENFVANSPSLLFSVFGRPLLFGGSSSLGGG